MSKDQFKSQKIINNQLYFFQMHLWNADGDSFYLNPEAVLHLVIDDDLHFWPSRGFFVYDNPFEILERKMVRDEDIPPSVVLSKESGHYNFRNDGKDFLDIVIRPIINSEGIPESDNPIQNLDPAIWEINQTFVIYDKEDVEVHNITQKMKKFYFWDAEYQNMIDNTLEWSTATSKENNAKKTNPKYDPSLASDEEREMLTGDAIKDILKENGFLVDESKFDKGSSSLLFSSYHDENIWTAIARILDCHMSEVHDDKNSGTTDRIDICLFKKDRWSQRFELEAFNRIFAKAGNKDSEPAEYQIEHLFFDETLGDTAPSGETAPSTFKAPSLDEVSTTTDVKMTKIKKYQFVDMSSIDSTNNLVTIPVHNYDNKTKTFSINMEKSNIEAVHDTIANLYIENKLLSKNGNHPLLSLNREKKNNEKINPVQINGGTFADIAKSGFGKLLYNSVFFNNCIVFQVDGATLRRSGRFVGIDRLSFSDNKFDYKLCGQWFMTKVSHIFFHNMYLNEVTGVKFHSYDTLNVNNDA